jgi:hypothetical protein
MEELCLQVLLAAPDEVLREDVDRVVESRCATASLRSDCAAHVLESSLIRRIIGSSLTTTRVAEAELNPVISR